MTFGPISKIICAGCEVRKSLTRKDCGNMMRSVSAILPSAGLADGRSVDSQSVDGEQRPREEVTLPESYQGHDFGGCPDTDRIVRSKRESRTGNRHNLGLVSAHTLRTLKKSSVPTEALRRYRAFGISYRYGLSGEHSEIKRLCERGDSLGWRSRSYVASCGPTGWSRIVRQIYPRRCESVIREISLCFRCNC